MTLENQILAHMQDLIRYGNPEVFPGITAPEPSLTKLAELAAIAFEVEIELVQFDEDDLDEVAIQAVEWWALNYS